LPCSSAGRHIGLRGLPFVVLKILAIKVIGPKAAVGIGKKDPRVENILRLEEGADVAEQAVRVRAIPVALERPPHRQIPGRPKRTEERAVWNDTTEPEREAWAAAGLRGTRFTEPAKPREPQGTARSRPKRGPPRAGSTSRLK
jgi:hypothetical protein